MSQQIQNLFDTIAPRYDLLNSLLSFKSDRRWRYQAVQILADSSFNKVLDLCAGTLAMTKSLLEINPRTQITALDFSQAMLDEGRATLSPDQLTRVDLITGDAMSLKFKPNSFDAVMCAYGMRNIEDNKKVLQHLKQILRPGGKLVILEFFRPEGFFTKLFNLTYAEIVIPVLGGLISQNPKAYQHLRDSVRRYYSIAEYKDLLQRIGFTNIQVKKQSAGISYLVVASPSPLAGRGEGSEGENL